MPRYLPCGVCIAHDEGYTVYRTCALHGHLAELPLAFVPDVWPGIFDADELGVDPEEDWD